MPRPLIIASLLGASIGVPYLAAQHSTGGKGAAPAASATATSGFAAAGGYGASISAPAATTAAAAPTAKSAVPTESPRFSSVDQFLRFDVTKEWIYRYWSRKSTGPTDVGLFSVRVPLVMGTERTALAGSLTYYFNTYDQVEHISFRGRTADATQLVSFVTRTYGLQQIPGPAGEQVYQVKRGDRVQSELRTSPEPILNSATPHRSILVELELARPGSQRFLPPRGPTLAVPQVESPPPVAAAEAATASGANGATSNYLDGVRYATPQEEANVLWKRWPN